jgi:hypothetical protein
MPLSRNITIGRDGFGNALVTGDNNLTVVLVGMDHVPEALLAALRSGRMAPADIPGAVPLTALQVTIDIVDAARTQWRVLVCRGTDEPAQDAVARLHPSSWHDGGGLAADLAIFNQLSRVPVETPADRLRLASAAQGLGDALARVLTVEEQAFLVAAAQGDPPPPLLVLQSEDDDLLGLPWELLRLNGQFSVRDGRLDVARTVASGSALVLAAPAAPFSLLVNISAPEGSGLNYERESYFIVRALHEHLGVVINEMGEVNDLVEGLRQGNPPPIGVHFSGHGGHGTLLFDNQHGERDPVTVEALLNAIRSRTSERLPRFFFLACCHGGDARVMDDATASLPSVATVLHRDGIAQVVGYFGPVLDELSTQAERAFYAELANGRRTRDAVRAARFALSRFAVQASRGVVRDAQGGPGQAGLDYAWARIVLYQRGPDHPLGTRIEAATRSAVETTERRTDHAYPGSRSQVLKAGFVGRRKEMHALRRDLAQGQHLHVVYRPGRARQECLLWRSAEGLCPAGLAAIGVVVFRHHRNQRPSSRSGTAVGGSWAELAGRPGLGSDHDCLRACRAATAGLAPGGSAISCSARRPAAEPGQAVGAVSGQFGVAAERTGW